MNTIFLGLTKGMRALFITLVPCDSSVIFSTTLVLNPVLWISLLTVSSVTANLLLPATNCAPVLLVDTVPLHVVSHAFQTVPIAFWFAFTTASKLPSTFIIKSGAVSVSNHSSPEGDKVIVPLKFARINGWTFSTCVAYGCSVNVECVYGNVIKSPVFW